MTATMRGRGPGCSVSWTPEKVVAAQDPVQAYAEYVQQALGVPWPTLKDMMILRRKVKEFFSHYPTLNMFTLCRLVPWAKNRRMRFGRVWAVIECFRDAFKDGAIPELGLDGQREQPVETRVARALEVETSQTWRRILIGCEGTKTRRLMIDTWERERGLLRGVH